MKKLDILCNTAAKKIVQRTLQSAMQDDPRCPVAWLYQPHRPEKKPAAAQPKTPSK